MNSSSKKCAKDAQYTQYNKYNVYTAAEYLKRWLNMYDWQLKVDLLDLADGTLQYLLRSVYIRSGCCDWDTG